MHLDFQTLYVVIILNSLSLIVVWAAIVWVNKPFLAARYWLASLVMTSMGGAFLALDDAPTATGITGFGISLIGAGFGVMWQGVRVFYGRRPRWGLLALIVLGSALALALVLSSQHRAQQNVVFAGVQMIPIFLVVMALVTLRPRKLGALVAAGAAIIAFAGHAGEAGSNIARLIGFMHDDTYYDFAAWFLVAVVIGCSLWNLGFLLMAIDRLKADLAHLATRDDLTGLPNRRGFREMVRLCEQEGRRRRLGAAVMMIDLDNFKSVNDRYGHAAGDACLVHVARLAQSIERPGDLLARLSGDEFCLLLPDTDIAKAARVADRLREAVASNPFAWHGHLIPLSLSLGLSTWWPETGDDIRDALHRADLALYETKHGGRNGVTVHQPEASPFPLAGRAILSRPAAVS
ncbi:GGDEF domain-containing protein [Stappia taiwanensis]|uniref:diguanylate cyclase n=1 Tax=Stappia taiwanensis TaxID=992267 RepID=A0A838XXD7_9HYPH|nr:GGDEF domain-containing protein [Stappia taiwanensis]MBA4613136.1 GGDEF domain-containing protein [Stappia taiwanensis]GGE80205.1 GGDEF domain-containing protein [Stappia taiwanensis]